MWQNIASAHLASIDRRVQCVDGRVVRLKLNKWRRQGDLFDVEVAQELLQILQHIIIVAPEPVINGVRHKQSIYVQWRN